MSQPSDSTGALQPAQLGQWHEGGQVQLRLPDGRETMGVLRRLHPAPQLQADLETPEHSLRLTQTQDGSLLIDRLWSERGLSCGEHSGAGAAQAALQLLEGQPDVDLRFRGQWLLARRSPLGELELFDPQRSGPQDLPRYVHEPGWCYQPLDWRLVPGPGGWQVQSEEWNQPRPQPRWNTYWLPAGAAAWLVLMLAAQALWG